MTEYIVEVDDKAAEVFVERFDWKTVTLFGHHLVGEIVRCRDCEHHDHGRCYSDQWSMANLMPPHRVEPDGFCKWGEKKR